MENGFLMALKDWGCDTDAELTRLFGDSALCAGYVRELVGQLPLDELAALVAREDGRSATALACSLADAVKRLGLRPLYEPLSVLAGQMRDGDFAGAARSMRDVKKANRELKKLLRSAGKR